MEHQPGRNPDTLWRRLWEWWKGTARKIGDFQARVLLVVFYFVLLAPFALLVRLTADPLALKPRTARGWQVRVEGPLPPAKRATLQF
jgi:hypothetical protein